MKDYERLTYGYIFCPTLLIHIYPIVAVMKITI